MAPTRRGLALMATGLLLAGVVFTLWVMELNWTASRNCEQPQQQQLEDQGRQLLQLQLAEARQRLVDQERRVAQLTQKVLDLGGEPKQHLQPPSNGSDLLLALAETTLDLVEESPEYRWLYVKHEGNSKLERVDVPSLEAQLKQAGANLAPSDPAKRLLVVVPFFNGSAQRWPEASFTIPYYRRYLSVFGIPHEVVLVEQAQTGLLFNKGTLYNSAYLEYMDGFDYMALMDVDSVPVFHRSRDGKFKWVPMDYPPEGPPYHLAREVEKEGWRFLAWFAGVGLLFKREQFNTVNGFSNNYYGWGSEDDDVQIRIQQKFGQIRRYGEHQGMFHSQPHTIIHEQCDKNNNPRNRAWVADLNKGHKLEDDGLRQAKYDIVHKGWTNKWGGFHWMRIVPKSPLMGSQVNRLPQEEIDACRAKLNNKT